VVDLNRMTQPSSEEDMWGSDRRMGTTGDTQHFSIVLSFMINY